MRLLKFSCKYHSFYYCTDENEANVNPAHQLYFYIHIVLIQGLKQLEGLRLKLRNLKVRSFDIQHTDFECGKYFYQLHHLDVMALETRVFSFTKSV